MDTPPENYAKTLMEHQLAHEASRAEQRNALWAMSPAEREAAMWRGELSNAQLMEWARRCPDEVPQINNEWAFIALNTPEVAELKEPTTPTHPTTPTAPEKSAAPAEPNSPGQPTAPAKRATRSTRPRRERRNDEPDLDLSR